jgi:hypothetical protein
MYGKLVDTYPLQVVNDKDQGLVAADCSDKVLKTLLKTDSEPRRESWVWVFHCCGFQSRLSSMDEVGKNTGVTFHAFLSNEIDVITMHQVQSCDAGTKDIPKLLKDLMKTN